MATLLSILARRIPRTEEPGGLQSMESQELDTITRVTNIFTFTFCAPIRLIFLGRSTCRQMNLLAALCPPHPL